MDIKNVIANIAKSVKIHSPEILTALGVSGVVTTSYLAAKAGQKHRAKVIEACEVHNMTEEDLSLREEAQLVWKFYIPVGISGAVAVGCIIGAARAGGHRTAAAVTAYSLTERAFGEYREKVVEQVGKGKEQKIRDEIAQDRVNNNPPNSEVIIIGGGHVLCCELYTGRYFRSDMETLRKIQNEINHLINQQINVSLNELYDCLGLDYTDVSDSLGWDSDKLLELKFTSVLSPDGEPCIAFTYNYVKPIH